MIMCAHVHFWSFIGEREGDLMILRGENMVSRPLHMHDVMTTHVGSNAGNPTSISLKERTTKSPEEWHVIYLPVSIHMH